MFTLFHRKQDLNIDEAFSTLENDGIQVNTTILKKAKKGDGEALYTIGKIYFERDDYPKALSWYGKASLQNYSTSYSDIGFMYSSGLGVPVDGRLALEWYLKAANLDDANAQCQVGRIYQHGLGVPVDEGQAMKWYLKASRNGSKSAQDQMENLQKQIQHKGIEKSEDEKRLAQCLADTANGDAHAMNCVGEFYMNGKGGVTQNYETAMAWYLQADKGGNHFAQNHIGEMYMNGQGVPKDDALAFEWFLKAGKNNNRFAQNHLGEFYTTGQGHVPQNYALAMEWYQKSAKQHFHFAQNHIGEFYLEGLGVSQNHTLAMEWFLRAAEYGNKFSMNHIGEFYQHGLGGTPRNVRTAIEWYLKSAKQNFVIAEFNLGLVFEKEEEVKDIQKAVDWYKKAADKGHEGAKKALDRLKNEEKEEKEEKEKTTKEDIGKVLIYILKDSKKNNPLNHLYKTEKEKRKLGTNEIINMDELVIAPNQDNKRTTEKLKEKINSLKQMKRTTKNNNIPSDDEYKNDLNYDSSDEKEVEPDLNYDSPSEDEKNK